MWTYVIKRLLLMLPAVFGASLVVFALIRLLPGDVVDLRMENLAPSPEVAQALREELGLADAFPVAYGKWALGVLHGDFGVSLWTRHPVANELLRALPVTLELTILTLLISTLLGIAVGTASAVKQDTAADQALRFVSILGLAVPNFWLGTLFLIAGGLWFSWAPPVGYSSFLDDPVRNLLQMLPPAIILGVGFAAVTARMARSQILEVLRQDFVRTARAKGLAGPTIMTRHVLKNAAIPLITIMGTQLGILLSGVVIVETLFTIPGLGLLTVDSIYQRDYPQLQANIFVFAVMMLFVNLFVDMTYAWLDPRIRYR